MPNVSRNGMTWLALLCLCGCAEDHGYELASPSQAGHFVACLTCHQVPYRTQPAGEHTLVTVSGAADIQHAKVLPSKAVSTGRGCFVNSA